MARKERKKKKSQEENSGGASWVTTFSDLMSLLLTFFILLFSMSTVSEEKFSAASQSIQNAFVGEGAGAGVLDGGMMDEEDDTGDGASDDEEDEFLTNDIPKAILRMEEEARALIKAEGIEDKVAISSDQEGIYLDIQESILFQSGEADITGEGENTLDSLVGVIQLSENNVVVEGFTDNVPMRSPRFPSNWELSTGRALSVVHHLADNKGIRPERLSAKGYGEFSPIVANDSPENRAKNRRVNIVLVYQPEESIFNGR